MRPIFCAKIVQKLCAHNFHTILGRGDSEVPKVLLHKFCAFFLHGKLSGNTCLKYKESRPFLPRREYIWSLPSVSRLAITAFRGPEAYFGVAIITLGAFEFIVPKY